MSLADFPELLKLSDQEKVTLARELLSQVLPSVSAVLDDAEAGNLLQERWARYEADPSRGLTLDEFEKRLAAELERRQCPVS